MSLFDNLQPEIEVQIPDNTNGLITPERLRDAFTALVDACIALEEQTERRMRRLRERIEALENQP